MGLILKIAWRNIFRHKGKSIIIGIILFLGSLIMTVGNGVISGMERGLQDNIINGFTGDIVIISDKQESDNVLFTLMGKAIEPVNNFLQIKETLKKQDYVEKFLPAGRNMALILNEEGGAPGFAFLIGVDFAKYQEMFPGNMRPVEGRLMEKGERGVIVPTGSRKMFYDYTNLWFMPVNEKFNLENFRKEVKNDKEDTTGLVIKNNIVFLGFNEKNTSLDVRLDIKGIVKFKGLDNIFGHFNIVDIESYRECLGYFSAKDKTVEISEEKKNIFENDNLDNLFGEDAVIIYPHTKPANSGGLSNGDNFESSVEGYSSTNRGFGVGVNIEAGTYNVVFVKLKKGISINKGLELINKELKAANLGARAVSWKKAFGLIGSMAAVIKGALFGFVMLLFIVAIIIIVNTLSMAALERTSEIGMMRAVGARKSFISNMFIAETGMLSFVFGGMGIILGVIVVKIIPLLNITSSNDMVQILYGGNRFTPNLNFNDIILTVIQLTMVTLIAVIYPVKVAKGITPLDAIMRD